MPDRPDASPGSAGRATSYATYLKVPELIGLQKCLSDPPEHDETLFIIIHQVYELWFRQVLHEIDSIFGLLGRGDARGATRLYLRIHEIQAVLIRQIAVLETMRPQDFLRFRDHLNPASGFQSYQFREVEFASGLKQPRYLDSFREQPELLARLRSRLDGPDLKAAWGELLRSRGLDYPEPAGDTSADEPGRERRLATLAGLYSESTEHAELYALAEAMITYDENLLLWRWHHVRMVERMIGHKIGTGGSEGVGYLQTTLDRKCFPELWEVRTRLGDEGPSSPGAGGTGSGKDGR